MRSLAAILLLLLFSFNLFGYHFLFYYAQKIADKNILLAVDNNQYNDADLITIEVPLSQPYYNNSADFERYDGEITLNGTIYKYVKRKVENGQLILKCLPDYTKTKLQWARIDFFQNTSDIVQNNHANNTGNTKPGVVKYAPGDYDTFKSEFEMPFYAFNKKLYFPVHLLSLKPVPSQLPDRPPRLFTI